MRCSQFPAPRWLHCLWALVFLANTACSTLPPQANTLDEQLAPVPVGNTRSALPAQWQNGVLMEIYVRGYQDSNGDGIGDLRGLISRLDYLQELGVTGLWLMPIFESQDKDHGYAISNYRRIEPDYGSLQDFDELIAQAHARGIGIVLDYVMNHSAADHPLFTLSSAARTGKYRDWYIWQDSAPPGWKIYNQNPWYEMDSGAYFAGFWNQMPEFNLRNPEVIAWHLDNLRFWLNRGVDGFRFDAVGNLIENGPDAWESQPENHVLMQQVRQHIVAYDNRYLVCEAPGDPQGFAKPDSCASSFAFGQQANVVGAAAADESSIQDAAAYFETAPQGMANLGSNHDAFSGERLWDQLEGNSSQLKLAAATYLLMPGTPFVYYGEEVGMAGAAQLKGDPKLRTPMSWSDEPGGAGFSIVEPFRALSANAKTNNVESQKSDPSSLFNFYKDIIHLRKSRESLMTGRYASASSRGQCMSFQRKGRSETTLLAFNYGKKALDCPIADIAATVELKLVYASKPIATGAAGAQEPRTLRLPAQSVSAFDLR
jgi:alpha-amylase